MDDNSDYEAVKQQIAECTENNIAIYITSFTKITEIPPLPEHITEITFSGFYCDVLLIFPKVYSPQLKKINIWGTGIKELPEDLPDNLELIELIETKMCKLPTKLPKNLKYLYISRSSIEVIPKLPETLLQFQCRFNNSIKELPTLPDTLNSLVINHTNLTKLPEILPNTLKGLDISYTNITKLPEVLPSNLHWLDIRHSSVKSLPKRLPDSLTSLYITHTPIKDLSENIPDSLYTLHIKKNKYIPHINWSYNPKRQLRHFINHRICMADIRMDVTGYHSRKRSIVRCKSIKEELMAATWHPDRVLDWCDPKAFDFED